ncbi:hypothetical protein KO465_02445 [Candidatus Micrarchaeota archaeon]|nr:hypothetical protein [Candidatus Micrarchaeota archaeon]
MNMNKLCILRDKILTDADNSNFYGYDPYDIKGDGLWSKIIYKKYISAPFLLLEHRFPIETRKILHVKKEIYSNSIALFLMGYLHKKNCKIETAEKLRSLLLNCKSKKSNNMAWGYPFDWYSNIKIPKDTPNITSTSLSTLALIEYQKKYCEEVSPVFDSVKKFYINELNNLEKNSYFFSYTPLDSRKVYNVNAMAANVFSGMYLITKEKENEYIAKELIEKIFENQLETGLWNYGKKEKLIDNYHTGFTIQFTKKALKDLKIHKYDKNIKLAIETYKKKFFDWEKGVPWFDLRKKSRSDIVSCAVGIWLFSDEKKFLYADKILKWTLENMMFENLYFYKEKYWHKKEKNWFRNNYNKLLSNNQRKIRFIRWGQAWMYFALSTYITNKDI